MKTTLITVAEDEHARTLQLAAVAGLVLVALLLLAPKPSAAELIVSADLGRVGVTYTDCGPVCDPGPVCWRPGIVVGAWPWVSYRAPLGYFAPRPWGVTGRYWRAPQRHHRAWGAAHWRGAPVRPAGEGGRHAYGAGRGHGRTTTRAPRGSHDRGGARGGGGGNRDGGRYRG